MALRAFPAIYARDVEAVAAFHCRLGFQEGFRMAAEDGSAGFIRLRRHGERLAYVADPEGNLVVLAGAPIA